MKGQRCWVCVSGVAVRQSSTASAFATVTLGCQRLCNSSLIDRRELGRAGCWGLVDCSELSYWQLSAGSTSVVRTSLAAMS